MDILVTVTIILFKMAVVHVASMGYREIGIIVITSTISRVIQCMKSGATAVSPLLITFMCSTIGASLIVFTITLALTSRNGHCWHTLVRTYIHAGTSIGTNGRAMP